MAIIRLMIILTNRIEHEMAEIAVKDGKIPLTFRSFEIKT